MIIIRKVSSFQIIFFQFPFINFYILNLIVQENNLTENFQAVPRKKLFLKRRFEKSDLTKALIPYKSLDKDRFGRSLTYSSSSRTQKVENSSKQCDTTDSAIPRFKLSHRGLNFVYLVLILCVVCFGYNAINGGSKKCDLSSVTVNPELLGKKLQHYLYGQPMAATLIMNEIRELEITIEHLSVLILLGGSGTGKTWTTLLVCIITFIT